MKWFLVLLLFTNLAYLGWEIDRQTRIDMNNRKDALPVPEGTRKLVLVRELPAPPSENQTSEKGSDSKDHPAGSEAVSDNEPAGTMNQFVDDVQIEAEIVSMLVSKLPDISTRSITNKLSEMEETCFSYGPFPDDQQSKDLIAWFEEHKVAVQQRLEGDKENRLFWIYLAQQDSRGSAIKAIEDLKSKGIQDYQLIDTGDLKNAISLGLFSTQAAVNRRLNELKARGYQPVVVPYRDTKAVYWVDIKLTGQPEVMSEMFTGFPAHYNSIPVRCSKIALK